MKRQMPIRLFISIFIFWGLFFGFPQIFHFLSGIQEAQALEILMLCGDASCTDVNKDVPVKNYMGTTLGHSVTTSTASEQDVSGYDVVVISESIMSGAVAWIKDDATPVLTLEGSNYDELGLGTGGGSTGTSDTQWDILDNSHFITSGYATGDTTVSSATTNNGYISGWANDVVALAVSSNTATQGRILICDNGDTLADSTTAAEKRAFFGAQYFDPLDSTGEDLFTKTLNWASGPLNDPPGAPTLYSTGGSTQLAFNNAKINDDTPTFRVAATDPESDDVDYTIEIDDDPNFGSVNWSEEFTNSGSHYTSGSQVNLTCSTLSGISGGTTYYVRVKAKDPTGSNSYGSYSSGTWSFTYNASAEDAMWHQTTDEQFDTGTLSGCETDAPNDRVKMSAGWLSGWDQRIKLTIDHDKIDSNLSDFPVLVYLSTSSGITTADVSAVFDELTADANRKKIAVTKSDGETECYVEIEEWDDASEKAWLWVKVSGTNSVSSGSDTDLYLYYDVDHADNTTYVGDSGSRTEVWDDGGSNYFAAVWHLHDDFLDSTSNPNNGTNQGSSDTTGKVADAQSFNGSTNYVDVADDNSLDVTNITLSAWIKSSTTGRYIIAKEASVGTTLAVVQSTNYAPGGMVTTIPLVLDSQPTVGNLLIAFVHNNPAAGRTLSAPDGTWTKFEDQTNGNVHLTVWWKEVVGGDGTGYIFTVSGAPEYHSGVLYEIQ